MSDSIGSVSVDVVPDASGFAEKLKAKLRDLDVKVGVNLDDAKAKAALDKLATTRRSATINAKADTTAAAAQLDRLAQTRTAKIRASVDKSGFAAAASGATSAASGMGLMASAAIALGPALIPATAAVAGLAGALAAPALTAGAGLGIFGAVTVGAIAKAKKDAKDIADLRKKATAATNPADAAKFAKQANELEKSLSKSERAFLKAKDAIGGAFDILLARSGASVFGVLADGANLLSKVMPKVAPIVNAFGGAIRGMLADASAWTDSAGFKGLVDFLAGPGVRSFKTFVDITKNVASGLGGLLGAFMPMGTGVLDALDKMTGKFAAFGRTAGTNSGFQSFLAYVRDVGPKVWQTLLDLGGAVGKVVAALAPQGDTMLGVIDALARTVRGMKPGQIAAVAGAVGALGLATGKFSKLTSLTLLVTAISYAYKHSSAFHSLADGAVRFADAINSLPSGVKIGLAGAAGLGLGAARLKAGGGVGGVVGKVLGGGVQKVFVTNMPPGGGLGGPGGGGPIPVPGKEPKGPLGRAAQGAGRAAGFLAMGFSAGDIGNEVIKVQDQIADGTVKQINLSKMSKSQLKSLYNEVQRNGIHLADGTKASAQVTSSFLRKVAKAQVDSSNRGAAGARRLAHEVFGVVGAFQKSGLSATQYGRKLHSLPKAVQTKVTTPGAIKSQSDIVRLKRQYSLTPKQVRTLVQLSGVGAAAGAAAHLRSIYASIPRYIQTQAITNHIDKFTRIGRPGGFAEGGFTGIGGKHEPAGIVHRGEFVVDAEQTKKYRGLLEAIQRRLPGYANGGAVGGPRQQFDLVAGMSPAGIRREFKQLEKALGGASKRLQGLERDAMRVSKAYNSQEKQLHRIQSAAGNLRSGAASTFDHDPFGGGVAGLRLQLTADTNDARAMSRALKTLGHRGISRGLASALAQSGDLDTAQQLAHMSRGQINQFDALYASRAQAQKTLGNTAANVAFGHALRELNQRLRHLQRLEERVEDGAERGVRRGMTERDKKAVHKRRAHRGGHK